MKSTLPYGVGTLPPLIIRWPGPAAIAATAWTGSSLPAARPGGYREGAEDARTVPSAATATTAALFLLVLTMLLRSRRRPVVTGKEGLLGAEGETVAWDGEEGRVRVNGEIWRARAPRPLQPGARIKVINREGLVLVVEPA